MNCISSASFLILINGEPKGKVTPHWGLRQGCPLSSYPFLFCAEALSCLINRVENMQKLQGIKINRTSLSILHLFFVDDSLLFFNASMNECPAVKRILHMYKAASGQKN